MINNGTRVRFHDGDYGVIIGHEPRTQHGDPIIYRIHVEGYSGGRRTTTATNDTFDIVGGVSASGNRVRVKARPYGTRP
jgi:hypothetical protein